jgi:hypothetical protein
MAADKHRNFAALLFGRRLELHYQFSGYSSAVFNIDALCFGPLADLGGIQPVCLRPALRAGWPPGTSADPACGTDVACQCFS